jgi:hypothetical protein
MAAEMLKELNEELKAEGVALALCRVHGETRAMLARCGVIQAVGAANIYPRMIGGVLAYLTEHERWAELRALLHDLLGGALQVVRLGKETVEDQSLAEEIEALIEQSAQKFDVD